MKMLRNLTLVVFLSTLIACTDGKAPKGKPLETKPYYSLRFDADSAYAYVQAQVDFGPRVPGTMPHAIASKYLHSKLAEFCDTAFIQNGQVTTYEGKLLGIKNIIGSIRPQANKRILLCAHWDTRPQADEDPDEPTTPADGANDGASGVGVLLEVARQLQAQSPRVGVDIVFFDAEDMGVQGGGSESWCLGSQYWSAHPHKANYNAEYGILLDMVGASDAIFLQEKHSIQAARWLVNHVWRTAASIGHGKRFVSYEGGYITDDHYFISKIAGIPTIDIIHYDVNKPNGFGDFWHTHDDNMEGIDRQTLKAVGETVLKTVWEDK